MSAPTQSIQPPAVDLEDRVWSYIPSPDSPQRGPVPASLLLRMLDRGLVNGSQALMWRPGMATWLPMTQVPPFCAAAAFYSQQWYYLDVTDGDDDAVGGAAGGGRLQQKGPILSRLLIHKLQEGALDGMTMVVCGGMSEWARVCDLAALKEVMTRLEG